jgi:catechol 2,3-dioxygenase-like lactoylglutathione lyase family enzyme
MAVSTLDHVNISSCCLPETIAFYTELLGMEARAPMGGDMAKAAWIYAADGRPVIHVGARPEGVDFLGEAASEVPVSGSGVVHHIALACTDYAGTRARLESSGHKLRFSDLPRIALRQIFIHDPNGILVELNFR